MEGDLFDTILHPLPPAEDHVVERKFRDISPTHYIMKIGSFKLFSKLLSETKVNRHESANFEVGGGYKWRLCLYPNGDEDNNGAEHISLYLRFVDNDLLYSAGDVQAYVSFFVHDRIRDRYLCVKDKRDKPICFNEMESRWGFPQLLPLTTFKEAANGYLNNDHCAFGVEVLLASPNLRGGETISLRKEPHLFTWNLTGFSTIRNEIAKSEVFNYEGYSWKLHLGLSEENLGLSEESLSIYLKLEDAPAFGSGQSFLAFFKLRLKDPRHADQLVGFPDQEEKRIVGHFSASNTIVGTETFIPLSDLTTRGFLVDDCLLVEQEFAGLSVHKYYR